MNVPWTSATAVEIGADWLLAESAPGGAFGRRTRDRERAFRPGDEAAARRALALVARLATGLAPERAAALAAAVVGAPDPTGALVRARSGGVLGDVDFFELARFLGALDDVARLAGDDAFCDVELPQAEPSLRALLAPGVTADRTFYLDDAFDESLARARSERAHLEAAYDTARSRLSARVARYAGVERLRDGEFVLMRERASGPLPPEIRVLREAPTYLLCDVALDPEALAALAARDAVVARVADLEEAVRASLSGAVAAAAASLERSCAALGTLDALVARVRFAQRHACVVPDIVDDALAFAEARYLPLAQTLAGHGRRYAPLTLELPDVAVVTGPNMGGKTAALRTAGFVAACVALGLPVPARAASVPLFDEIAWLGIAAVSADAAESEGLLSAFGREVVELQTFLSRAPGRALALLDEFARTTSPREGRALLVAAIATLRERRALGLVATHLSGIAADAHVPHFTSGSLSGLPADEGGALPLDAALRRIAEAMDYRLSRVDETAAPASDALALAGALGLDPALLERAKRALYETGA